MNQENILLSEGMKGRVRSMMVSNSAGMSMFLTGVTPMPSWLAEKLKNVARLGVNF